MRKLTVSVNVDLNAEDLARTADKKTALQFVKDLDLSMGDWEFTLELYQHFNKLHEEWKAERAVLGEVL